MYAHLTLACLLAALNIQFELRYEEVERARAVFERYVEVSTALPAIEHGCSCGRTTQSPLLYTLTQVLSHRSTHTLSLSVLVLLSHPDIRCRCCRASRHGCVMPSLNSAITTLLARAHAMNAPWRRLARMPTRCGVVLLLEPALQACLRIDPPLLSPASCWSDSSACADNFGVKPQFHDWIVHIHTSSM